ncbi:MAG: T9SS type A sorting domain-containing protein [Bacteroidota bacterium]
MKKLLLAYILFAQLNIYSQASVYKPFCNNPSWTVVSTNFGVSNYTTYQYQTDTIIGAHTYKKTKDVSSSAFALFREDPSQKKVYQYDVTNSTDYLYIDFSLNYGDPFTLNLGGSVYSLTVCTKDSMLINGCYHNKVSLSNNGGFISYNFVEGILSEINPIYPFRWPGDPQVWTTCECHSGQFYYTDFGSPFSPFSCNLTCTPEVPCPAVSNIDELMSHLMYSVHPNPAISVLNITDELNQLQNATIEVKNCLGQVVLSTPFTKQLNISDLTTGIYFFTVQNKGGKKTVKFVKE